MKKTLLALTVISALSNVANAESSVSLYGLIDEGYNIHTNIDGNYSYNLSSGILQGSRWGVRGIESLNNDLRAIFVLENGFDLNNFSKGNISFNRQAYVGIATDYGAITIGRQYDSIADFVGPRKSNDQWGGRITSHPGDLDNFNNTHRINNSIKFTSANFSGFKFGGLYSLGGKVNNCSKYVFSLGTSYNNGPFAVGIGYLHAPYPKRTLFENTSPVKSESRSIFDISKDDDSGPMYAGYDSAHLYQVLGAATTYKFKSATIGATYSHVKFKNLGYVDRGTFSGETAIFNNGEVNFKYQLTPELLISASYDYTRGNRIKNSKKPEYHQGSIGLDYSISKRTDIYMVGAYQRALGDIISSDGYSITPAVANINNIKSKSSTKDQFMGRIGVRHRF